VAEEQQIVMDADAIARVLRRVASEIVERTRGAKHLGIVGIRRGGVPISNRLAAEIRRAEGREIPVGTIDITLYRDDAATALPDPKIGPSAIPFEIKGRDIVLVDDVLHTGRTVRAAIDCLLDYGRPRRVWLAVLFDRGGRELPVAPDFFGKIHEISKDDLLDVIMDEGSEDRAVVRRGKVGNNELGGEG
jgi:pyrimidine operon attenuation protein/uracil phosphoribosyltransferase